MTRFIRAFWKRQLIIPFLNIPKHLSAPPPEGDSPSGGRLSWNHGRCSSASAAPSESFSQPSITHWGQRGRHRNAGLKQCSHSLTDAITHQWVLCWGAETPRKQLGAARASSAGAALASSDPPVLCPSVLGLPLDSPTSMQEYSYFASLSDCS